MAIVILLGLMPSTASALSKSDLTAEGTDWVYVGLPTADGSYDGKLQGVPQVIPITDVDNLLSSTFTEIYATVSGIFLDSTTDKELVDGITQYAKSLAYLEWISNNALVEDVEAGSDVWGFYDMILQYGSKAVLDPTREQINNTVTELHDFLIDKYPTSTSWDLDASKQKFPTFYDAGLAGTAFVAADSLTSDGTSTAGATQPHASLLALLQMYADAGLLAVVAKSYPTLAESVESCSSYQDLVELVDESGWMTGDLQGSMETGAQLPEDADDDTKTVTLAKALYQAHGTELAVYLNLVNTVQRLAQDLSSRGIHDYTYNNGTEDVRFKSYHRVTTEADYVSQMSKTFQAIYWTFAPLNTDVSPTVTPGDADKKIEIDTTNGALGMLSNCTITGGQVIMNDNPELTDLGYAILAAGATYDPFVSVAGNDSWLSIVSSFVDSETDIDYVNRILQVALNTKKPLYVTEADKGEWPNKSDLEAIPSAQYRAAYLQDLLERDKEHLRAYAVIKGSMSPSNVDGSTWDYINKSAAESNTSNTVQVDSGNESGDVLDAYLTAGTEEVFATSYQMTTPLMFSMGQGQGWTQQWSVAKGFASAIGGTTSMIVHNAAQDAKDNSYIRGARAERLFINGLGDIVLANGVVVLPAIANPLLYVYDDKYSSTEDDEEYESLFLNDDDISAYYPYTATFMNHLTGTHINEDGKVEISSEGDENKLIPAIMNKNESWTYMIKSANSANVAKVSRKGKLRMVAIAAKSFRPADDITLSYTGLSIAEGTGRASIGDILSVGGTGITGATVRFITRSDMYSGQGFSYFPLIDSDGDLRSSYLAVAGPIVTSALRYVSVTETSTGHMTSSGRFRISHYIESFLAEGLLGTQYAETLTKNSQVSYEDLVADQSGRFLKFLIQITESACESLGKIDGVLSIKGPYENTFFNILFRFIQEFYLIIAIILMVFVASKFFKGHFNVLYVCFIGLLCIAGFEVYANWLPTLVPQVYNFAVNDTIEDVVWNTVLYNAESYSDTYKSTDSKDPVTGAPKAYTSTITLYQLTNAEMRTVAARQGVPLETLQKGEAVFLDEDAGIFVQGNMIKMSVDSLLAANPMRGLYKSQWDELGDDWTADIDFSTTENSFTMNPYSIQLTGPQVSLEAYYTPYDHIERALMSQLNTFATYFRIQRNSFSYDDGAFYKDAFLVKSYLYSGIVTAPGDRSVLQMSIIPDSVTTDQQDPNDTFVTPDENALIDAIQQAFYPEEDWLGLIQIFELPDKGVQDTLWGYLMQYRGWFDLNWKLTPYGAEKVSDMIRYINTHTKMWCFENIDNLAYCSDENAIKMISLYATTCFTHYFSEISEWVYPNYVDASGIALKDVLYGSMTSLKDRNFAYDGTVVNTVGLNLGVFGVIFLLLIILFSAVFVFIVTYMVPILYALLGGIIIFKLVNDEDSLGLIKGYTKVTIVSAVLYFLFSLSLKLVRVGGYMWYAYLGCALCIMLCCYFLFWVVLSVVTDVNELGNNTLTNNLLRGLDKLTFGAVRKLSASTAHITNRNSRTNIIPRVSYQYGRQYSIDNYSRPMGRRFSIYSENSTTHNHDYGAPTRPRDYSAPDSFRRRGPTSYGRNSTYEDRTVLGRRGWADRTRPSWGGSGERRGRRGWN